MFFLRFFVLLAQITTSQYDNARTGADLNETELTPRNVNFRTFGKVAVLRVDGDVYAQPLYVPGLDIPGQGIRDVVFIATAGDSVYAFDTAAATAPLWHRNFTDHAHGISTVPSASLNCPLISPQVGITATPVIDPATQTLYVLVRTRERDSAGTARLWQRLHALDLRTGTEKFGGPIPVQAVSSGPKAWFGLTRDVVQFSPLRENPRAGLTLVNGQIVLTWGSSCDVGPYHGWVITYNAHSLKQTGVFITSPEASDGGIWQSDAAPAADSAGNLYVLTGNGEFTAGKGGRDYGDSILKLQITGSTPLVQSFFTPFNQAELSRGDLDLGSGGPVLISSNLLVAAGKSDAIYLLDPNHLGGSRPRDNHQIIQTVHACGTGSFGAPAYWNGHLYYLCRDEVLKDFAVENRRLILHTQADAGASFSGDGATPTVSAHGLRDGIVWAVECHEPGTSLAVLHAYDATDVSRELYNSNQTDRDHAGAAIRFVIPTVANGRVYVGGKDEVDIYGLLGAKAKPTPAQDLVPSQTRPRTERSLKHPSGSARSRPSD